MKDKILLFIPMYNCEKQILRVLGQLTPDVLNYVNHVLIVNNRSTDSSEAVVVTYLKAHPDIPAELVCNTENYGLGGSHKVAFRYAVKNDYNYIIVLHGDDQGSIRDLLPLIQSGEYKKYDCCLGARFKKGAKLVGYSGFRTFGNRVFNVIFSIATGRRIYDLGAGLNMYSVSVLKTEYYKYFADNLTFNCHMLFALSAYKQSCIFFPITWREEDQVSNVKMVRQATQTLQMAIEFFFLREKYIKKDLRSRKFTDYTCSTIFKEVQSSEF